MKLLMHMCCGPCSVYPVEVLRQEGFELQGLFYNPNIHPIEEYERRKENVELFSKIKNLDVDYISDFRQTEWENFKGPELSRCTMCYTLRLEKAAEYASQRGFDAYTTTLLVSPYQRHDLIRELGEKFASKYGVQFLYRDFRPGFREGQRGAKEMGLYRQKYCGCIISYENSNFKKTQKP